MSPSLPSSDVQGRSVALQRDAAAIEVPQGTHAVLGAGHEVFVKDVLPDGNFTVAGDYGQLYRIEGKDADALGIEPAAPAPAATPTRGKSLPSAGAEVAFEEPVGEDEVWATLRTIYDPEIPVNMVDLGLVYRVELHDRDGAGKRVEIDMTLTAPGCGMADVLKQDVEKKVDALPGVEETQVEVVFDPPWCQDRMSEAAKLQLGFM